MQILIGNATFARWARPLAAALAGIMVLALFVGGSQPAAAGLFAAPWDKLAHGVFFAALTVALVLVLSGRLWLAVLLALTIGALDEFHQGLLPGRVMSLDDWLADAVGVVLVSALGWAGEKWG